MWHYDVSNYMIGWWSTVIEYTILTERRPKSMVLTKMGSHWPALPARVPLLTYCFSNNLSDVTTAFEVLFQYKDAVTLAWEAEDKAVLRPSNPDTTPGKTVFILKWAPTHQVCCSKAGCMISFYTQQLINQCCRDMSRADKYFSSQILIATVHRH